MKRFLSLATALAILCVFSTSCNITVENTDSNIDDSLSAPENRLLTAKLSARNLNTKVCYGQGYETDDSNRPIGAINAQSDYGQYGALFIENENEKVIYLTFDEGYENGYTAGILDTLKKHNVPAAFFLVGDYLERNPDLVRRMVEEGHIVGNHTASHPDMSKISQKEEFSKELQEVENLFREITGKELPKFYRPPQGVYSQKNLEHAQQLGYKTVFWSLAYADWDNQKQPTRDYAFGKLMPRTHNGAVILLHATSKTNAEILDELLTRWKQQGYEFASIDRLFKS